MVNLVVSAGIFSVVYAILLFISYMVFKVKTSFIRFFFIFLMIIEIFLLAILSKWFLLGIIFVIIYMHLVEGISYSKSLAVSLFPYITIIGGFAIWLMIR